MTAIPLYHVFALGSCLAFTGMGGTNVLVSDPRPSKKCVRHGTGRCLSLRTVDATFPAA
jgi:hypothetical protein